LSSLPALLKPSYLVSVSMYYRSSKGFCLMPMDL
jgi:hypothetical protein